MFEFVSKELFCNDEALERASPESNGVLLFKLDSAEAVCVCNISTEDE